MKKILLTALCLVVLGGCSIVESKYEGKSAQEWFEEYDKSDADRRMLLSEKEELIGGVDEKTETVSDLEYEIDELISNNDDLVSENEELEDEIESLKNKNSELEDQYEELESRTEDFKDCLRNAEDVDDVEYCANNY